MLPRIGIPWYRAKIKQSVFEDAGSPRGFNFRVNLPLIPPLIPVEVPSISPVPSVSTIPVMVGVPSEVLIPGTVPGVEPSTVPGFEPSTVPRPVPGTVPNPVPVPNPTPVPVPNPVQVPKPILPPYPEKEDGKYKEPALKPIPQYSYIEMMEMQKVAQRQIINDRAYKELVQTEMLLERNLAQRRIIDKNAKLSAANLSAYERYLNQQSITVDYNRLAMSKEIMDKQVKAFNEAMKNLELKATDGLDIVVNYIKKNEITLATIPHHYKEINREIAKAGLQGLAVGVIVYLLYQIAKVAIVL